MNTYIRIKWALASGALCAAGLLHAQSILGLSADDGSLTYKGVTLYGVVDIGVQYQTHGAAISDYFAAGSADIVQKNSNHKIIGITPNNVSQSRVGLSALEPLGLADFSAILRIESYFNPQSGQLSDGPRSLIQNNGKDLSDTNTNLDSSIAGQPFEQGYLGASSKTWGTFTWGRQNTLLADLVAKYDPNSVAQAFSLVGLSGTAAGGGDTENRRLDNSVKYAVSVVGLFHAGVEYKFNQSYGGAATAWQLGVGAEYAGLSFDVLYAKVKDAIAASSLSASQVSGQSAPGTGFGAENALAATISDNISGTIASTYNLGRFKVFAALEYIEYRNPSDGLPAGTPDQGYNLAYVNNTAFPHPKQFQVYWAGVRFSPFPSLDLALAYYGYHQNSYGAGQTSACSNISAGTCSGRLHAASFQLDYRLSKRFDGYLGAMYTTVENGLANGYVFSRNDLNPTLGGRVKF